MKNLVLSVAVCFVFAAIGYADRCSDLCDACRKSQSRDISTCCKAESACNGKCDAVKYDCPSLESDWNDDDRDNQHRAVFAERWRNQDAREAVDRGIRNYQQNFQPQWMGQPAWM